MVDDEDGPGVNAGIDEAGFGSSSGGDVVGSGLVPGMVDEVYDRGGGKRRPIVPAPVDVDGPEPGEAERGCSGEG